VEALDSREFAEWMAYYSLEPWGEERADLRAGIIASTIANRHRDPKREKEAYKPQDFMPLLQRPSAADTLTASIKQGFAKFKKQVKARG